MTYLIMYLITVRTGQWRYVMSSNPNISTYKYVNIPKKTMKKTLIMYLNLTYPRCFSPDPNH